MAFVRDLDNLVPIMTSNTAPSGYVASASSESSGEEVFYIFNGTSTSDWATATGQTTGWAKIQLPSAKIVNSYLIYPAGTAVDRCPNTFTFQGSNNNTDWTILDSQSGVSTWATDTKKKFVFSNTTAYLYYKLNVTANNGHGSYLQFGELELCATGQYASLIPPMTSDTAPSGVASASSNFSTNYAAWQAFNGANANTIGDVWAANEATGWLQYQFPTAKVVKQYSVQSQLTFPTTAPKDWAFWGSNDGSNWTTIDTQTNITGWLDNTAKTFSATNNTAYTYYRINITANNGYGGALSIGELRLFGTDATTGPLRLAQVF